MTRVQAVVVHLLVNPVPEQGHVHVHAGCTVAAADTPRDDAGLLLPVGIADGGTCQRAPTVSLYTGRDTGAYANQKICI